MSKLLYTILFLSLPILVSAQYPWEAGGGIGAVSYLGDLDFFPEKVGKANPALQFHVRRNAFNYAALRGNLLISTLTGDDSRSKDFAERGFSFFSPLVEGSVQVEIYPLGMYRPAKGRSNDSSSVRHHHRSFMPYLLAGVGGAYVNPKVEWNRTSNPGVTTDQNFKAKGVVPVLPFGGGFRFILNDRTTVGMEVAWRPTFSDYIDGISAAGNPNENDWYFAGMLTLSRSFGFTDRDKDGVSDADDRCPTIAGSKQASGCPDADRDGTVDDKDPCPDQPGPRSLKGCPDTDKDGVADSEDKCPDQAGKVNLEGCPDTDNDGIADLDDACPEQAGILSYRGCPAEDRDKDGVADLEDNCPDMAGTLVYKGCPDSDNDGMPDDTDVCPGIAGSVALKGCPDTDNDGISDKEDQCPTIAGTALNKGCPGINNFTGPSIPYKAIFFDSQKQDWYETSYTTLEEVLQILAADPALFARVEGNTDNTGDRPANQLLSEQRAKKCYDFLLSKGVAAKRLTYSGFAEKRPIASNATVTGRQLNRRVEIHFYK